MSAGDTLAELTARTEGHARGPWEVRADHEEPPAVWHDGEVAFSIGRRAHCGVEAVYEPADAELIAAAPKLLAALKAVQGFHAPTWQTNYGGGREMCRHDTHDWPCPTVRAITAALA